MQGITKADLIAFENDIFNNYSEGNIRAPVHLTGSENGEQEDELIRIFQYVREADWVFSTHRSHYHAILKSQNPEWVKGEIFKKRSSHINSKKYKVFTSAIVGGNLSIALGVALAIKRRGGDELVWCFTGDMASEMGIYWECLKYAENFDLPIMFIVEDNGWGVYTPTADAWGGRTKFKSSKQILFNYERRFPHYGVGKWITF